MKNEPLQYKECILCDITSIRCPKSNRKLIDTSLVCCLVFLLSTLYFMAHFSKTDGLMWTKMLIKRHICERILSWKSMWGLGGQDTNFCLVSSLECWPQKWGIPRIVFHTWSFILHCISWRFENLQIVDFDDISTSLALLCVWLSEICWPCLFVLSRGLISDIYLLQSMIVLLLGGKNLIVPSSGTIFRSCHEAP